MKNRVTEFNAKTQIYRAVGAAFNELSGAGAVDLHSSIMDATERQLIRLTLDYYRGNQVHAAEALGMHRNTLRTKIKQHGLVQGVR